MVDFGKSGKTVVRTFNKLQKDKMVMVITTTRPDKEYIGRIDDVGVDYITLQQEPIDNKETKKTYFSYPELIRIDAIVSMRRDSNCKDIKSNRGNALLESVKGVING